MVGALLKNESRNEISKNLRKHQDHPKVSCDEASVLLSCTERYEFTLGNPQDSGTQPIDRCRHQQHHLYRLPHPRTVEDGPFFGLGNVVEGGWDEADDPEAVAEAAGEERKFQ